MWSLGGLVWMAGLASAMPELDASQHTVGPGDELTLSVSEVDPFADVQVFLGRNGIVGTPACVPQAMECLGFVTPAAVATVGVADGSGSWSATLTLPQVLPLGTVHLQAVADGAISDVVNVLMDPGCTQRTWFEDVDGDGFGTMAATRLACAEPRGFAEVVGDCDDGDVTSHVGAVERCDGLDNDCDGAVDDAWRVPVDFPTIQAAVDAATTGDAICLEPGVYAEHVVIMDKFLTLGGASVPGDVQWVGPGGSGSNLHVERAEVELAGLVIADGFHQERGAGIYGFDAKLGLRDVSLVDHVVRHRSAPIVGGAAVFAQDSVVRLERCEVARNLVESQDSLIRGRAVGGGIAVYGDLSLRSVEVRDNAVLEDLSQAHAAGGGVYWERGVELVVRDSTFDGNQVETDNVGPRGRGVPLFGFGGGLAVREGDSVVIEDTEFVGNGVTAVRGGQVQSDGGGLSIVEPLYLEIARVRVVENEVGSRAQIGGYAYGGGLRVSCTSGVCAVRDLDAVGNFAGARQEADGAGVFMVGVSAERVHVASSEADTKYYGVGLGAYIGDNRQALDVHVQDTSVTAAPERVGYLYGGGLYLAGDGSAQRVRVAGTRVIARRKLVFGGGLYADAPLLTQVIVVDNSGEADTVRGGGIYDRNGGDAEQVIVAGNSWLSSSGTSVGGGVFVVVRGNPRVWRHIAVVKNELIGAGGAGGGVAVKVEGAGTMELVASHIVGNRLEGPLADGAAMFVMPTLRPLPQVSYVHETANIGSTIWFGMPDPTGMNGNMVAPPRYENTLGPIETWDLTLRPGSPAIDAGPPGTFDEDGTPADIGAYGGPGGAW